MKVTVSKTRQFRVRSCRRVQIRVFYNQNIRYLIRALVDTPRNLADNKSLTCLINKKCFSGTA